MHRELAAVPGEAHAALRQHVDLDADAVQLQPAAPADTSWAVGRCTAAETVCGGPRGSLRCLPAAQGRREAPRERIVEKKALMEMDEGWMRKEKRMEEV